MSARKGGLVRCMDRFLHVSVANGMQRARLLLRRHAEMLLEGGRILDQRPARARMDDRAAIEDERVVGHAEDLLRVLLDHDGGHALVRG